MITLTNAAEPEIREPLVLDYRRARTALVLLLAATAGVPCRQHPHDLRPGISGSIEISFAPRTHREFVALRHFLSSLQDNGLVSWLHVKEPASITTRERGWLADYGLAGYAPCEGSGE